MKCGFNQEMLSAYLDNESSSEQKQAVENHISRCPECSDLVQLFRNNDAAMRRAVKPQLPDEYWRDYGQRLSRRMSSSGTFKRYLARYAILPLAAAILLAVTLHIVMRQTDVKPPEATGADMLASDTLSPTPLLVASDAALVNIANLDENNSEEIEILKQALLESGLMEKIRLTKYSVKSGELQMHLAKLEAVFIWVQNENSPVELQALKEVIFTNGLIEQNREKRFTEWR
ncbi:MAG: zf-HC2 domain-containing protein [Planctomycetota bacterium]